MEALATALARVLLGHLDAHPEHGDVVTKLLSALTGQTREEDGTKTKAQKKKEEEQPKQASKKKRRRPKRPRILQCKRCQQFDHMKKDCKELRPTCGVCAAPHDTSCCVERMRKGRTISRRCALCGEKGHSAPSYKCSVRVSREKEIRAAAPPAISAYQRSSQQGKSAQTVTTSSSSQTDDLPPATPAETRTVATQFCIVPEKLTLTAHGWENNITGGMDKRTSPDGSLTGHPWMWGGMECWTEEEYDVGLPEENVVELATPGILTAPDSNGRVFTTRSLLEETKFEIHYGLNLPDLTPHQPADPEPVEKPSPIPAPRPP